MSIEIYYHDNFVHTEQCSQLGSERATVHSCDDLLDLLGKRGMKTGNDPHMDKNVRKHLQRKTLA